MIVIQFIQLCEQDTGKVSSRKIRPREWVLGVVPREACSVILHSVHFMGRALNAG